MRASDRDAKINKAARDCGYEGYKSPGCFNAVVQLESGSISDTPKIWMDVL
jgi:hypothetical protein